MDKESLIKAKEILIKTIGNSNINRIDKAELLINIFNLLSNYDESIKVLQKHNYKTKRN